MSSSTHEKVNCSRYDIAEKKFI